MPTTPTIASQMAIAYSSDGMIDLYKLDCSNIGGSIYYFSPQCYQDGTLISFNSQVYNRIPIGLETVEEHASTQALPQPVLSISNVQGPLMSALVSLGDLVGASLTYIRTKTSYLDGQANADPTKYIGPQVWYVFQKSTHTNVLLQWALSSPMDRPGMMLPVRQILKDAGVNPGIPVYFPGVTPYRINPSAN